jgi:hypothetical protein
MFGKRGELLLLFFGLFVVVILLPGAGALTGRECDPYNQVLIHCGGHNINQLGYGAVELCQVCYQCGVPDGVCPEAYSDGRNETQLVKTTVYMRTMRQAFDGSKYTVAFQTGRQACASIGGNCTGVQRSTSGALAGWITLFPSLPYCYWNVSDPGNASFNNAYFRALCSNAPRKAGCEYCPDPDCTSIVSGKTYDANTGLPIDGVKIEVSSQNSLLSILPGMSNLGEFEMSAVTGVLSFSCTKEDYSAYTTQRRLGPGRNIVDCAMNNLTCNQDCTVLDQNGQRICRAACDQQGGCSFFNEETKIACENHPAGEVVLLNWTTDEDCTHEIVTTATCCNGSISTDVIPCLNGRCNDPLNPACGGAPCDPAVDPDCEGGNATSNFFSSDVSTIITRNYRKEYNGIPVTLKILVYEK